MHHKHVEAPAVVHTDYVELKPGWRIRVVVPILRSGGYITPMATRMEGNVIVVSAGKDFIGYETDYYVVQAKNGSGIRVAFTEAEAVEEGKSSRRQEPAFELFGSSSNLGSVRLVYLTRESHADHDMFIVASADERVLEKLTSAVISNDEQNCKTATQTLCVAIPRGIAVIPEQRVNRNGRKEWISAR